MAFGAMFPNLSFDQLSGLKINFPKPDDMEKLIGVLQKQLDFLDQLKIAKKRALKKKVSIITSI